MQTSRCLRWGFQALKRARLSTRAEVHDRWKRAGVLNRMLFTKMSSRGAFANLTFFRGHVLVKSQKEVGIWEKRVRRATLIFFWEMDLIFPWLFWVEYWAPNFTYHWCMTVHAGWLSEEKSLFWARLSNRHRLSNGTKLRRVSPRTWGMGQRLNHSRIPFGHLRHKIAWSWRQNYRAR